MTSDQRERLRIVIEQGILVRRGARIDADVAEERSRNLTTIVEILVNDFKEETTKPGPPAEMERDAENLLRRTDRCSK